MKTKLIPTPVPSLVPHQYACDQCSNRRTFRNKLWQVVIWCDTCRHKTIHRRID